MWKQKQGVNEYKGAGCKGSGAIPGNRVPNMLLGMVVGAREERRNEIKCEPTFKKNTLLYKKFGSAC